MTLLFTQCVTSSLQTARTLPKGEFAFGPTSHVTFFTTNPNTDDVIPSIPVQFGGMVRYGLGDNLDGGVTAGLFTLTSVDVKYRYLGTNETPFAASTGVTLGFFGGSTVVQSNNVASYFFHDRFALTSSLRPGIFAGGDRVTPTANATLGLRAGGTWGLFLEGGVYTVAGDWDLAPTFSVGIFRGL